ncbi:MAG TPA: hypothetical protein VMW10_02085, partial [Alphaproteobacteria bacterium]|nr:hypothetical protein [Alphaproteobacteria bacterium]
MIDHANKQRGVQYYIIFLVLVNVVNWLFLFVTSHYIGDFAGLRVSVEPSVVLLMLVASLLPFLFLGHLLKKTSSRIAHAAHFNEKAWIIF